MDEYGLQRKLKKLAEHAGVLFFKLRDLGSRGFPDVMLIKRGRIIFVELKSPKGTGALSKVQQHVIKLMRDEAIDVRVIDNLEGCIDVIEEITNKH